MDIKTLHSVRTEYSADTVEWCPYPDYQQYFTCGTYHLDDSNPDSNERLRSPARRKGRIYLYHYDIELDKLEELLNIESAAILDMKWSQINNMIESSDVRAGGDGVPIIATANAVGEINVYKLYDSNLQTITSMRINEEHEHLLTLAIDWNNDRLTNIDRKLVASDSRGNISLLRFTESNFELERKFDGHSFEAWTCCFNKSNSNIIYSGGDDQCLHVFDSRLADAKVMTNRMHMAGVTSMLSFDDNEFILATGSYDEELRIFDTRQFKRTIANIPLGGGIWRIKRNPLQKDLLLCACMYHNFSIVNMGDDYKQLNVVGEYFEHSSICYGADWCYKAANIGAGGLGDGEIDKNAASAASGSIENNEAANIMVTCSFYDNKMCISSVKKTK